MSKTFEWDDWLSNASYKDVCNKSPALQSIGNLPSYNPDNTLFYLSSLDIDVDTSNQSELKSVLASLDENFKTALKNNNFYFAWVIQIECEEICNLLCNIVDNPTEYSDPSVFLSKT